MTMWVLLEEMAQEVRRSDFRVCDLTQLQYNALVCGYCFVLCVKIVVSFDGHIPTQPHTHTHARARADHSQQREGKGKRVKRNRVKRKREETAPDPGEACASDEVSVTEDAQQEHTIDDSAEDMSVGPQVKC